MYYILLISTAFAIQYVPIPDTPNGYVAKGVTSKLVIEAYYDLVCPDSKESFETLERVMLDIGEDKYDTNINSQIQICYKNVPLAISQSCISCCIRFQIFS